MSAAEVAKTEKKKRKQEEGKSLSNNDLRNKIITKYKSAHEEEYAKLKDKVNKVKDKDIIKNALSTKDRSLSITSISSNDSILSDSHKKKHKKKRSSSTSSSDSSSSSGSSSDNVIDKKKSAAPAPGMPGMFAPGMFPGANPETGEWMGMGMYPFPFYAPGMMPAVRPGYYPNSGMYRGRFPRGGGNYRGRFPRGRGRGGYSNSDYKYLNLWKILDCILLKYCLFLGIADITTGMKMMKMKMGIIMVSTMTGDQDQDQDRTPDQEAAAEKGAPEVAAEDHVLIQVEVAVVAPRDPGPDHDPVPGSTRENDQRTQNQNWFPHCVMQI